MIASGDFAENHPGLDYDKMKAFVDGDDYVIKADQTYLTKIELQTFDSLLPSFFHRKWILHRAPDSAGDFITSDNPVCSLWSSAQAAPSLAHPPGFGLPNTTVLFPISRQLAITGSFEQRDGALNASAAKVAAFNAYQVRYASSQVYAPHGHFRYRLPSGAMRTPAQIFPDRAAMIPIRRKMPSPTATPSGVIRSSMKPASPRDP